MKMTNPEIEVVRFGTEDILTTSGASRHSWNPETNTLTCLNGNGGEMHFFVDSVDNETAGVAVTIYFNEEGTETDTEHGFGRFAEGTPAAGQWWYISVAEKKYHLCGSGQ